VRPDGDGTLTLTVSLPFERYLEGIAEVPSSWPAAALEAQAVAARSYALATTGWEGGQGETLDQPICATAACQVYRGIPVPFDPTHRRWVRAVRRTAGRVLLFDGRPATTVYFSTSNGHTYGNEDVFGSDPLPYLRPVIERDDGASGTSRWTVRIPFEALARFLSAAELWPPGRTIAAIRRREGTLFIGGRNSRRLFSLADVRDAVNTWAPCLEPHRYPPGSLPLTIPSRWWQPSVSGDALIVRGRGWGHGAGMVQWGAFGKARRGFSAEEILAYYYGGLAPEPYPEPGTIHVIVATGLIRVTAMPSGPGARVGGRTLDADDVAVVRSDTGLSVRS
jgi:stage II sporulation protein D